MALTFKVLIISMFVGLFMINIIFRARVMKAYKYLVKNDIRFTAKDILSKSKMENDILSKYPDHQKEIKNFVDLMKTSLMFSIGLIVVILALALIFNFFI